MKRSTDRILTTHVGALQRPAELSKAMTERGEWAPDSNEAREVLSLKGLLAALDAQDCLHLKKVWRLNGVGRAELEYVGTSAEEAP